MITKIRRQIHQRTLNFRALDRLVPPGSLQGAGLRFKQIWVQFALISGDSMLSKGGQPTLQREVGSYQDNFAKRRK